MISLKTTVLSASAGTAPMKTARLRTVGRGDRRRNIDGTGTCIRFPGRLQAVWRGGGVHGRVWMSPPRHGDRQPERRSPDRQELAPRAHWAELEFGAPVVVCR